MYFTHNHTQGYIWLKVRVTNRNKEHGVQRITLGKGGGGINIETIKAISPRQPPLGETTNLKLTLKRRL